MIVAAIALTLVNISDTISDLKTWHAATTPPVVGPILKEVGTTILAVLGGKALPRFAGGS